MKSNDGGVVNDAAIRTVYASMLHQTPLQPTAFSVLSSNPAAFGSKGGIRILQLLRPFHIGRVDVVVVQRGGHAVLSTINVSRFRLWVAKLKASTIVLDDQSFKVSSQRLASLDFVWETESERWSVIESSDAFQTTERGPRNAVGMELRFL